MHIPTRWGVSSGLLGTMLMLAGCAVGPIYQKPEVTLPQSFKEAAPLSEPGVWKAAQPSDQLMRGEWWTVFGDDLLDDLERRALSANQNLKAALARVSEARAISATARAGLFPTLDVNLGPARKQASAIAQGVSGGATVPPQTLWRAQASMAYEVDMFGRVSDTVKASEADAARIEALLRSLQLALQADVAQHYFNLRQQDAEIALFARAVALRERALDLAQSRFDAGQVGALDVARAQAELASVQSDAMTVQRARAISEHSLAVLLGEAPAQFSLAPLPISGITITVPAGLPSSLLERRPDIAAAERAMAAANARVGVAKSAFFPSLSLTGMAGFESGSAGNLLNWSNRTFLLGPLVGGALNLPLFDGGRRTGNLANARAAYEEEVAQYRQQVLVAFREVEDSLSDLRILAAQAKVQSVAVAASEKAEQLSQAQYDAGAANYLDVIDAQRSTLQAQRIAVQLIGIQAISTVNLIRALGGGWGDANAVAVR